MAADKRQIETRWEDYAGTASEHSGECGKLKNVSGKGRRRIVRGREEQDRESVHSSSLGKIL